MTMEESGKISRRDFAKASALAGLTAFAASPSFAGKKVGGKKDSAETLRIGIIGCGGRGTGAVVNCLTGVDNVKLVAVADAFQDRIDSAIKNWEKAGKRISEKVDVKPDMQFVGLDAYQKLLKTDVDVVIHATSPWARPMHIEAIIDAGKHLFTEKPLAVDPAGIRRVLDAAEKAKKNNQCVVTGLQRRHQGSYIETIKQIQDGKIGKILTGRAYWNGGLPFSHLRKDGWSDLEYRLRNWYNQCWTCGDNIVEQHVHNLDIINWALGSHPEKVVASGGRAWKPAEERFGDIWDNFTCDYEYPNGVHVISMSRHWNDTANAVFEEVTGTNGISTCCDMGKQKVDPYVQEHIDLFAAIRGEEPYRNELFYTAESTMTAIMGRMAAYTGEALTWEKALKSDLDLVPKDLDFAKAYPLDPIPVPGKPYKG
jgi:predicted dehydrogenase